MERIRIHGSFADVDERIARKAVLGREYEQHPGSSRIIVGGHPSDIDNANKIGCQYAHRERAFGQSILGDLGKLSEGQAIHVGTGYDIKLRHKYGAQSPANIVIYLSGRTWKWNGRRYRRNLLAALDCLGSHRLFFVIDKTCPTRVWRSSSIWRELSELGALIFLGPPTWNDALKKITKLHEQCEKYDVVNYGVQCQSLLFNGHYLIQDKFGLKLIMTGAR